MFGRSSGWRSTAQFGYGASLGRQVQVGSTVGPCGHVSGEGGIRTTSDLDGHCRFSDRERLAQPSYPEKRCVPFRALRGERAWTLTPQADRSARRLAGQVEHIWSICSLQAARLSSCFAFASARACPAEVLEIPIRDGPPDPPAWIGAVDEKARVSAGPAA
jgi:hypothetical protein